MVPCHPILQSKYSHNATLLTFETPRKTALSLPVCSCILLKTDSEGEAAIRPYTPVSQETDGEFDLLVKEYPDGVASQFLAKLKVGETAEFKHIIFNVKIPYPFKKKVGPEHSLVDAFPRSVRHATPF